MTEPVRITLPCAEFTDHSLAPGECSVRFSLYIDQVKALGAGDQAVSITVTPTPADEAKLASAASAFAMLAHVYARMASDIRMRKPVFRMSDLEAMGLDADEIRARLADLPKMTAAEASALGLDSAVASAKAQGSTADLLAKQLADAVADLDRSGTSPSVMNAWLTEGKG